MLRLQPILNGSSFGKGDSNSSFSGCKPLDMFLLFDPENGVQMEVPSSAHRKFMLSHCCRVQVAHESMHKRFGNELQQVLLITVT